MEETRERKDLGLMNPRRLLLAGLTLGGAFDLLFNGKLPGISAPVFAVLVLVGLALSVRWEKVPAQRGNLRMLAALLFFAAMIFVRANGFLMFLNSSACLMLLALIAVTLTQRPVAQLGLPALLAAPLQAVVMAIQRGGRATAETARNDLPTSREQVRQRTMPILRGLLLALPVLILFGAILASADLIFADRLDNLFSRDLLEDLGRWTGHTLVTLTVGFLMTGGLVYTVRRRGSDWENRLASASAPRFVGRTESLIVVNAVNLLFGFFVAIQVQYLFGGKTNIAIEGFTYAEYARRGFGELVAVAVLTLGMLVLLNALMKRNSTRQLGFNLSGSLLMGLTCMMLVSAFKRLLMYEAAYGYTRMRIYPHVFMVWLGVLLVWFVVTLWLRPRLFAVGVLVAALGFVATLDVINPDGLVVRENFRRAEAEALAAMRLDGDYLSRLSADAVPALLEVYTKAEGDTRASIEGSLQQRAVELVENREWWRWQSFHLARWRAWRLLEGW